MLKKSHFFRSILFLLFLLLLLEGEAGRHPSEIFAESTMTEGTPPPGEEYPVAYWAQTHISQALLLHRKVTPENLQSACRTGVLKSEPKLLNAWKSFRSLKRRAFCQKYPYQTLHLLGEAPYFMLRPPGSHR